MLLFFFLISGAVIPLSLQHYSRFAFIVGRIFRIWPVYIAGFTVTLTTIYFASHYFAVPFDINIKQIIVHYFVGMRDLLGSRNIDGVIWTLEVEIKYYFICLLAAPLFKRLSCWVFAIPFAIGVFCFAAKYYVAGHVLPDALHTILSTCALSGQFMIYMYIGTLYTFWREKALSFRQAVGFILLYLILFFALVFFGMHSAINFYPFSYVVALSVFFACAWKLKIKSRVLEFFSDISYPLYAVHIAVGYTLLAILLQHGVYPLPALLLTCGAAMSLATLIHYIVELPSHQLGRQLAKKISMSKRSSSDYSVDLGNLAIQSQQDG